MKVSLSSHGKFITIFEFLKGMNYDAQNIGSWKWSSMGTGSLLQNASEIQSSCSWVKFNSVFQMPKIFS